MNRYPGDARLRPAKGLWRAPDGQIRTPVALIAAPTATARMKLTLAVAESVTPSDAARRIRCAIFALVAGVRWPISIWSTAASSADRIVETSSGSNLFVDTAENEFGIRQSRG